MVMAIASRLHGWLDLTVLFGLNFLLQSTVIIVVGLAGAYFLRIRHTGAAAQSLLLRIFLVGVILSPVTYVLSSVTGMRGLGLEMKLHAVPAAPAVAANDSPTSRSLSSPEGPEERLNRNGIPSLSPAPPEKPAPVHSPHASTNARGPVKPEQPSSKPGEGVASRPPRTPSRLIPALFPYLKGISSRLPMLFIVIWVFLSVFLALRAGAITLYIRRIRSLSFPLLPHHAAICQSAADELKIPVPDILQSPYVSSALLTGVFRPVVLIPFGGNENIMATREVFIHEFAHLARRDPLWLHLCLFAKILLPFQPLLWVLARRIEELSDYACDDYVITHTGGNRTYASMLMDLARASQLRTIEASVGSGILSSRFPLVRRIRRIIDNSYSRHISASANEVMSFTIIFLCAVTLSGFVGIRGEDASGTAYAAEHPASPGEKTLLKTLSRLHIPLAAPLAAVTMEKQRADASLTGKTATHSTVPEKTELEREPLMQSDPEISEALSPEMLPAPQATSASQGGSGKSIEPEKKTQSIVAETASIPTPIQSAPVSGASDSTVSQPLGTTDTQSKTAVRDALPLSGWLELSGSAATLGENATAPKGQVKITVPNSCGGALKESLEGGQENPVWSPTGTVIAFTGAGGKGIWAVSPNGGIPHLIQDNTASTAVSAGNDSGEKLVRTLCFSPNGKELTYVKYDQISSLTGANKKAGAETFVIESINLDTGERREIVKEASEGCWSADSRYFVYVEGNGYGIGVLDIITRKRRQITETGLSPCLTHDGASIIYVDQSRAGMNDLYRVPLAGGTPEQLTSGERWRCPKISPDGEWVLSTGYGIPQYNQDTLFWAFNLRNHMSYYFVVNGVEAAEMGTWSPSGLQYCYTRYTSTVKDGAVVSRPLIYIDNFQSSNFSRPEAESAHPQEFKLVGNYPNPFNPSTTIQFSLSSTGPAELDVYNMLGQKISTLVSGRMEAGMHSVVWNGRDQNNKPVSSGIYVARLKMEGKVETSRMTLVK